MKLKEFINSVWLHETYSMFEVEDVPPLPWDSEKIQVIVRVWSSEGNFTQDRIFDVEESEKILKLWSNSKE